ncbi:MAG TPA: acyloxyacyl hydrolase [Myxococcota bacterium]|nr:acyloxyacyl hydrolase [Myxococcota bacterium]
MRIYLCSSLLGLTALLSQPCLADPAEQSASPAQVRTDANFGYGKQEWSIAAGYGFGVGIGGSNSGNLKDIRFGALVPRWGVGLTDPLAEGTWYEGNLDLLVEGAFLFEYHPVHGFAGGGTLVFRYNFLQSGRVVPFIEAGAGILGTDLDLKGQSDGFNFSVQGGLGLHFFVLPRVAVTAEARLHHISNAGLRAPNNGINDSLFLVGASFFLR